MSLTRRLAAGLPAVGVTALAALALAGSPAHATGDSAERAGQPSATVSPCTEDQRTKCASPGTDGYGGGQVDADESPIPNDNATSSAPATGAAVDDDRGEPGYGGESPAPSPSETTPTTPATADTTPPGGGVSPATVPATPADNGGGTLPLTGAPMGATLGLGGAMVLGGAAAVWYTRRRQTV